MLPGAGQESPPTGPETEKRFPQLQVPPGFKATLYACDPLIEYPSVLALGPRPGSIFLAHDSMTGLGFEIVRRSEIRLVEDTDSDGYADKSTLYAGEFNSLQGLAADDGRVYAMHSPFLTALRDANDDGIADERRDLFTGIGWPPEKAPDRLHGANGVVVGRDGWLYLALGDRGCDVVRPEGDRLVLEGGGILRSRPDGSDLHVFSTGLRNIYDVALDRELNVFVRDNENDGGTYMIRVCRSFFGADHGYPYLYQDHPRESLAPLADLGRGSSAGSVFYLANAFPGEYHGALFCCEWGRSIVRYRCQRSGAGFAPMQEIEFAAGAPNDPYGFKPTDLVVDRDGSLLVSDWADDQRPKRGRGRVYRIRYEGARGDAAGGADRLAEVWALARTGGDAIATLFGMAETDPDLGVRIQAVRAIADLTDPVLSNHRLEAGRGDSAVARRLAALGRGQDPRILLEVVVALGRLRWDDAPSWLRQNLGVPDASLAHAAQQTLRRAESWPAVLEWLDESDASPLRAIASRALAAEAQVPVADGLLRRFDTTSSPLERRELAELLARIHRKPGPWVYWGFRPGPRPANTRPWERTEAIENALDGALRDPDRSVRLAVLRSLEREKIPAKPETLIHWLREDRDAERAGLILAVLGAASGPMLRDAAEAVVRDRNHAAPNRLVALKLLTRDLDAPSESRLLDLAGSLEESAVLAEALRQLALRPRLDSRALTQAKLGSSSADVRAAAAAAAGKLAISEAAEPLLALVEDPDALVRGRSLEALAQLREPRALGPALRALDEDPESELPALECLAAIGGPEQAEAVAAHAMRSRSLDAVQAAVRVLSAWGQAEAVAQVQGASGVLLRWTYGGPFSPEEAERAVETASQRPVTAGWRAAVAGPDSRVAFGPVEGPAVWLGAAEFIVPELSPAQFLASSNGTLTVWVNGLLVHRRAVPGRYATDSDRFDTDLKPGLNRLVVQVSGTGPAEVHVRFRRKSAVERHERLAQLALTSGGNAARGRELYLSTDRTGCGKCHSLGGSGGRIGPDLTGVGRRFSRIHLVESILEPSRSVAPAYRSVVVRLENGQVETGVKVVETERTITLGDAQGQTRVLEKSKIEEQQVTDLSVMPEGLEKLLGDEEFVDLIAFLAEQR